MKLPQIITNAKRKGWYDWIVEPDGELHPNTERALLDGYYFEIADAMWVQNFCTSLLTLPRAAGESVSDYELSSIRESEPTFDPEKPTSTKPFAMMEMWHRRIIGQLYGWKHPTGRRRYKKAFVTTAKKTGKTTTLSALPLAELFRNNRPEKEVYVVASTQSQAANMFKKTFATLKRSDELRPHLRCMYAALRLVHDKTDSFFAALPNDPNSIQGIEPDLLILDELHAWYGREVYDALVYGDLRREESLRIVISTAGDDEENVCFEEYELAKDLLDPGSSTYKPDQFAFVAEAGKDPITGKYRDWDWDEERCLVEANPTLLEHPGPLVNLRAELESAKTQPGKKRSYIRYLCNRWVTSVEDSWINIERWRECAATLPGHVGESVYCGLDLAEREDIVALAMAWKNDVGGVDLRWRMWIPEEDIDEKAHRWRAPLRQWIEEGWLTVLPGASIPIDHLRHEISGVSLDEAGGVKKKRSKRAVDTLYDIKELAFDRALAKTLVYEWLHERDGIMCVEHGQGYLDMSPASKTFFHAINNRDIRHDGNPVIDWMMRHCIVTRDPAGNIKPDKRKNRQKIDGVVAACMAVGRIYNAKSKPDNVYKNRGVICV